ncbi:NAD(P)/FAD-dependent oxidoreductase [Arthrobacter sp. MYb227]|uniref:NAD(P)/FAD-dependent oxidoreductase n=1 Tax=Arthrobacter sp. MYb227 TaxID=1848601 RepID=UPI002157E78E|nr:NAD(P)/FAD-dependent oxidoreductase [Arthrobacter sp. MYb227]
MSGVGPDLKTVIIGAGQAGLSAAHHLLRKGHKSFEDFMVLDANDGPGGAWLHRWDSLTFDRAHGLHPLPGFALQKPDPSEPASAVVARYYGAYEAHFRLPVIRPFKVKAVNGSLETGFTILAADGRKLTAQTIINATGTWDKPYWPSYRGQREFTGRQLHTHNFRSPDEFLGKRVLVVGGGTSAAQFLLQFEAHGIQTLWSTRRPPQWRTAPTEKSWGIGIEAEVNERTHAGLPPRSVVSVTGLPMTDFYAAGIESGVLISRGKIASFGERSVRFADGSSERIDVVLWATGFRASLDHLASLNLREPGGGILMDTDSVSVARVPGLFLVGYGASASTIGATRAGRAAAVRSSALLDVRVLLPTF